jgi:hypothetical protein|nr:MAG TPA: hypothetical protein [Caudoviricetes sp.]
MEHTFEVGETVFFMGKVSPWFWHKGEISKIDEQKGVKIGKVWYTTSAVMKDSPNLAVHLLAMNIEKSMMMCKGKVQYEGESLDSYLTRNRKEGEE